MSRKWKCCVCEDNDMPLKAFEPIRRICETCLAYIIREGGYPPQAEEAEWLRRRYREDDA